MRVLHAAAVLSSASSAVYLMRSDPAMVKFMARQIRAFTDAKADKRFACVFVPKPSGAFLASYRLVLVAC